MTIWGAYRSMGSGYPDARVGFDLSYSPSSVSTSTTSVTVSWTLRVQVSGGFANGNDSWSVSGGDSASGTKSWSVSTSGGTAVIASGTQSVSLIYGQSQSFSLTGTLFDAGAGTADPTVTASLTIPARPLTAPAAPTGVTLTRVSDTQQTVSWTRNATTAAPYQSQRITRSVNFGPFQTIADLSGTATSFSDNSTQADTAYRYNVVAANSAGSAVGTPGDQRIDTTPATPPAPSATKQGSGDIVVTRSHPPVGTVAWSVRHVETGTVLATGLTGTTWTHVNPSPTTTWSYSVQSQSSTPVLSSGWSPASNTIQLIAPPLAPTPTGPGVADPADGFHLTWNYNPVDGTPQRSYQVESRASSGDAWVALTAQVNSTTSQHYVPPGAWSGTSREWRVRTWGQHADPSPYSQTATLALSARPVAAITEPALTHDSPRLTVRWSYHDPEGTPQNSWRVTLRSGALVLEALSGTGTATSRTLTTELADGGTYTVQVEVRDGVGLWSAPASQTFTVIYAPPPSPTVDATFHKDEGYTVLTPNVGAPAAGEAAVSHLRIERATASGWQVLRDDLAPGTSVVDMLPPLGTVVHYRAVAVSVTGSVAHAPVDVETRTKWVFINHGPGFGQVVRVYGNLQAGRSFSRDKSLKRYAGRPYPVERAGTARERTYTLTGTLFAPWAPPDLTSTYEDFEAAADAAAPVCVRDPEGVRLFVSTGAAGLDDYPNVHRRVSLPMTQVDYTEIGMP